MPYVFVSTPKSVCVKHSRLISRSFSLRWKIGIKLSIENRYLLVFLHSRTAGERTLRSEFSPMFRTTELNNVCACVIPALKTDFESFARSIFSPVATRHCFLAAFIL